MITGLSPLCKPEGRKEEHFKRRECTSAGPLDFKPSGEGSVVLQQRACPDSSGELHGLVTRVRSSGSDPGSSLLCFDDPVTA